MDDAVILVGSRSGAAVLLGLMAVVGVVVGLLVARGLRLGRRGALPLTVAVALALVGAGYATSADGFYEVHAGDGSIELRGLFPGQTATVPLGDLAVELEPAAKSSWRVTLTSGGRSYSSASSDRGRAEAVANRVRSLASPTGSTGA